MQRHQRMVPHCHAQRPRVHIVWDLDNIVPPSLESVPDLIDTLRSELDGDAGGLQGLSTNVSDRIPPEVSSHIQQQKVGTSKSINWSVHRHHQEQTLVAANERTIQYIEQRDSVDVERWFQENSSTEIRFVRTSRRRGSVDMQLKSGILEFCKSNPVGVLVCISNDGDFAGVLRYVRHKGMIVVSVGSARTVEGAPVPHLSRPCLSAKNRAASDAAMLVSAATRSDGYTWTVEWLR